MTCLWTIFTDSDMGLWVFIRVSNDLYFGVLIANLLFDEWLWYYKESGAP